MATCFNFSHLVGSGLVSFAGRLVLSFENLTLGYDRHPVVHHLSAEVPENAMMALVGPNGAGKSTLFKAILGQIPPLSGHIHYKGCQPNNIAYLPQSSSVDRHFPMKVRQFVASGLWSEVGNFRPLTKKHWSKVDTALEQTGLLSFSDRSLDALSGGQFQRLLFARKLVQDSPLLLLDEPFNGVDEASIDVLCGLLNSLHAQGKTIVAVVHDLNLVRRVFPQTLLLSRELIGVGQTSEVLTEEALGQAARKAFQTNDPADICQVPDHA